MRSIEVKDAMIIARGLLWGNNDQEHGIKLNYIMEAGAVVQR